MQQPLVSVLMTSYNRERYIGEAIESVMNSTYKNFELIIVDDGSKDATVNIAKGYAETDPRIRVYINEKNLGDYPNRNRAASYAKGKYLKYVDSDDKILPEALETFVNIMENSPEAALGLGAVQGENVSVQLSPEEAYLSHYNRKSGLFSNSPLTSIIKKDAFDEVHGFNHIRMAGDFDMWHKIAQRFPVVLIPRNLVWYRKHEDQEMNAYRQCIKSYENAESQYLKSESCPLKRSDRKRIYAGIRRKRFIERCKNIVKKIVGWNKAHQPRLRQA
jgi:glycosyltransferase involved in cell wall biosynthesis